jgi:wyosine [tRNA(Phe)-imidazoG37] synthetase (radical SAM superfamily)
MGDSSSRYSYGPVPSRRLGRSLGINNIPATSCTYSCVYCQVGRTERMEVERRAFYEPASIAVDVRSRLAEAREASEEVDYLAFVPDGEATLDVNLGREIALLKDLGIPVGVITNGSLLWREDVRRDLGHADWVSVKVDAVDEAIWRRVDRPHRQLELSRVLAGIREFAATFPGELVTETMLVEGVNDSEECVRDVADFVSGLRPARAYLSIPTRPPAEPWVRVCPDEAVLNRAYQLFAERVGEVEYLIGYEGDAFASTGDAETDLLGITAVHPMRAEAVKALLSRAGCSWEVVDRLTARGDLVRTEYDGHTFYLRSRP